MKTNSEAATIWRGIEKKDVLYLNVCVVFYLKILKDFRRLYPQIMLSQYSVWLVYWHVY